MTFMTGFQIIVSAGQTSPFTLVYKDMYNDIYIIHFK